MRITQRILVALFASILTLGVAAEQQGVFKFTDADISKVLDAYRAATGLDLVVASNIEKAPGKVSLESKGQTSASEAARLIERALLDQAGVIITRLDSKRASVTYNDALALSVSQNSAELRKLRDQLNDLLLRYSEEHPAVKKLRSQIADLEQKQNRKAALQLTLSHDTPRMLKLREQLTDLLVRYTDQNPAVQKVRLQIAELEQKQKGE